MKKFILSFVVGLVLSLPTFSQHASPLNLDIRSGPNPSFPQNFSVVSDMLNSSEALFFAATNGASGLEPFIIQDGQVRLITDIEPGSAGSNPYGFTKFKDFVYFFASQGNSKGILFRSNANPLTGTSLVRNIFPENQLGSQGNFLTVADDSLFFAATDRSRIIYKKYQ